MKRYLYLIIVLFLASCHVTETIKIEENGSGSIETEEVRDEDSYLKIAGENYAKEEKFQDTTYFFKDIINKYDKNFFKLTDFEKDVFVKFKDVEVTINKNSYTKDFRTRIYQKFDKIENVPDFYKTEDYADDLKNNYALSAEEHYFNVNYTFDGTVFRRIIKLTSKVFQEKKIAEIAEMKTHFGKMKINQTYVLNYSFPRKIKYVSNNKAKISDDKKSMILKFVLSDCIENPDITSLEIVLENIKNE
jgi:hypothetical protein